MPEFIVPDLKVVPREGGYARGQDGVEQILRAALTILVEQGFGAVTMRAIAKACDMKLGNVTYYFPTRDELVRALFDAVISSYEESFEAISHEEGASIDARFENIVRLILEDITTKKTTRFFTEIWALANHDAFVSERMDELYRRARVVLNELIAEINPALPEEERETVALFISASLEGTTMFAGHDKPWRHRMDWLETIACRAYLPLIKSLKPGDIRKPSTGQ
ncbi:TetR/AcrR family transcriptional regulator [Sphingosinicella soli]|uniref:AcrR family transcriptional regulator n=1 Tax=Sphingosinicella soli TaxID=333708 RepID=A0A7W7B0X0_9SPHN|nr:TetR/AcrR family transcriptional regulator [Sphingosinicella soli]MBB4630993.1 AcrR family transcriptional regulator [Sphingosinicella soli]